jgi:hypothetical protein
VGVSAQAGSSLHSWTARKLLLDAHSLSSGQQTAYIIVSIVLVIVAGLSSGLTLGLLSLDRWVSRGYQVFRLRWASWAVILLDVSFNLCKEKIYYGALQSGFASD